MLLLCACQEKPVNDKVGYQRVLDAVFSETGITPQLERMVAYEIIGDMNFNRAVELNRIFIKKEEYLATGKQFQQK
ncbi:hypothetical protein NE848_04235 [Gramella jeungdoensis]|uniref:Uncharacterized protein n=1 Tax=Gramella jeungdoensis TaxID=708091 RepID=A0ABT0YZJ8_9FLAO|nr:hypothetical protein [Gramella jeungdoensis]MCM8568573.1 hypothetical protein [Gramella jeungdoensis]